ncbi:uncharacterized protein BT62DRAFT_708358 [Guyanagaster necrorhizus]|uniref:Uncharacterized protein n=1 Tax=Guyanagaster necrorhizus TaxID=856835 RepID=A0A9P7VZ50_9AGAR|nr:uncharacterized protein BT62DRAFT_708358 [Guyanagaster necrorhizus MCA 3950]KAG7448481.1 hypothetical protein BT62DRAFT_708358 [Guyanagaster necrorhizus MCA 3950]
MHKFGQLLSSVVTESPLPYPTLTGPSHWNWNFVPRSTLASASSLSATLAPDNLWNESLDDTIVHPATLAFESLSSSPSPSPRPISKPPSKSRTYRSKPVESIKEEPGSPRFIIEPLLAVGRCSPFPEHAHSPAQSELIGRSLLSQSLAPPTQVPLRATQANDDMRSMMGVFRLNPFTIHGGNPSTTLTWCGEEAGPLESMPVMLPEWQIPSYDAGIFSSELPELTRVDVGKLERLSPSFEAAGVKRKRDDYEEGDDDERPSQRYKLTEAIFTSESPSAEYSTAESLESLVHSSPSSSPIPVAAPTSVVAPIPSQTPYEYSLKQESDFDDWGRRCLRNPSEPSYKCNSSSSLAGFMGDTVPSRVSPLPSRRNSSDSSLIPPLSNACVERAVDVQFKGIAPMLNQPSQALVNNSTIPRNTNALPYHQWHRRSDACTPASSSTAVMSATCRFPTMYQQQWEQVQQPVARSSQSSRSSVSSGTPSLTYDMTRPGSAPYTTPASNYSLYAGDSSASDPLHEPSYTVNSYSHPTSDPNRSTTSMRRMPYHLSSPFSSIGMEMVSHVRGSAESATFYG